VNSGRIIECWLRTPATTTPNGNQPAPEEKPNKEPEAITPARLEDLLREIVLMVKTAISAGTLTREVVRGLLTPLLKALDEGEGKDVAPREVKSTW